MLLLTCGSYKVRLFKTVCGIFHFRFHFVFIKVGLSPSKKKKIVFICFNDSPSKMMKYAIYFILKALFVLKILRFLSWAFRRNSVIRRYDVTAWLTKNCNTHIAQYLTNYRQPDNEIWSVNRPSQEKYFSLKIMQKMRQRN